MLIYYEVPFVSKFVFSVDCDNVTLPESIAVTGIYPFNHWKSSHESLNTELFTGIYGKIRYLL